MVLVEMTFSCLDSCGGGYHFKKLMQFIYLTANTFQIRLSLTHSATEKRKLPFQCMYPVFSHTSNGISGRNMSQLNQSFNSFLLMINYPKKEHI